MAKYDPLGDFLAKQRGGNCTLTHGNIEEILGARLPPSATRHRAWWGNEADGEHVQCRSWLGAGWGGRRVRAASGSGSLSPRMSGAAGQSEWI